MGHPSPAAITGGNASGKDAAERKEIDRTGMGGLFGGTISIWVASESFSGIAKNEGMLYLYERPQDAAKTIESEGDVLTNRGFVRAYPYIAR